MEIGETVAMVVAMQAQKKCVLCGRADHESPKQDVVKEVAPSKGGWHRKSMNGVFESDGTRNTVYPSNAFPPAYAYQGHHCLALSALVANANGKSPTDRRLRLNFYLDQVGFFPNRPRNCIGLPARRSWGDFDAFVKALDLGKPLQMHGPGHDEAYFTECDRLLSALVSALANPKVCAKKTKEQWKDLLKKRMEQAENYAFRALAGNDSAWRLHPTEQSAALELYFLPADQKMMVLAKGRGTETRNGLGRAPARITFPKVQLDVGPFV